MWLLLLWATSLDGDLRDEQNAVVPASEVLHDIGFETRWLVEARRALRGFLVEALRLSVRV